MLENKGVKFLLNTVVMLVVLILVSRGGNNFVDFSDDKNGAAGCVNDCDNAPENKISNKNGGCRVNDPGLLRKVRGIQRVHKIINKKYIPEFF